VLDVKVYEGTALLADTQPVHPAATHHIPVDVVSIVCRNQEEIILVYCACGRHFATWQRPGEALADAVSRVQRMSHRAEGPS
jgi:hypothetical protein